MGQIPQTPSTSKDFDAIENRLAALERLVGKPKVISTTSIFPSNPINGDFFYYAPTAGIVWVFIYEADLSLWIFVGGEPIILQDYSVKNITSTSYISSGGGPSFIAEFSGYYTFVLSCNVLSSPSGGSAYVVVDTPANPADDNFAATTGIGSGIQIRSTLFIKTPPFAMNSGATAIVKYKSDSGINYQFSDTFLHIIPFYCHN